MARQRRVANPAQVRAHIAALRRAAGPPQPRGIRRRVTLVLLNLLAVLLLSVSFAPFDCWYLAYAALAPWVLALAADDRPRVAMLSAWAAGLVFWLANLYWLWWITLLGYFLTAIYLSAYWLLAAAILRRALRRSWPMWAVLPAIWVALEYLRGYLISGFPWFFLAHSQYGRTPLIQIADLTGQYGVSFLVAMANGAITDLLVGLLPAARAVAAGRKGQASSAAEHGPRAAPALRTGGRRWRHGLWGAGASAAAAAAMMTYGWWRVGQQSAAASPGPVIGIVQQVFPVALGRRGATQREILDRHLAAGGLLADKGCDLLLAPESMLGSGLNADFLTSDVSQFSREQLSDLMRRVYHPESRQGRSDRYLFENYTGHLKEQAGRIGSLSRRLDCPILGGCIAIKPNPAPIWPQDAWLRYNGALWFDASEATARASGSAADWNRPLWLGSPRWYSKVHLVPFSEYVPFKHSWPALHRFLRSFVPEVMEQLEPGEGPLVYELLRPAAGRAVEPAAPSSQTAASSPASAPSAPEAPPRRWRLATPICYEGVFDYDCRRMVSPGGAKAVDVLVNLSNDGWFVWQISEGRSHYSTEYAQHLAQYCFRAVENRVPVVRAVNTGISASIDSSGRILARIPAGRAGTLLLDGGRGADADSVQHGPLVLVDARASVYSRAGDVFAMAVSAAAVVLAGLLVWRRRGTVEGATS